MTIFCRELTEGWQQVVMLKHGLLLTKTVYPSGIKSTYIITQQIKISIRSFYSSWKLLQKSGNIYERAFWNGWKNREFLKFSCQETCNFCNKYSWFDEIYERIPEPFPDYTCEDKFKYLNISVIPAEERVANSYHPALTSRRNIKKFLCWPWQYWKFFEEVYNILCFSPRINQ